MSDPFIEPLRQIIDAQTETISRLNEQVAQLLENNRQLGAGQDRLRAELASFKENGCDGCELPLWWAEAIKLRAELAAEKERAADMPIVLVDVLLSERERCAKIAEGWSPFTPNSRTATNIAAAIRASNAAPPHVEPAK